MEKSDVSNNQKDVQTVDNKKIYLHIIKPEYIPVGSVYKEATNLDNLVDNFYDEIMINDLLDYMNYNEAMSLLDILKQKLANQGSIIIQSVDLKHLASSIVFSDLDIDIAKNILYNHKKTIYILKNIESELKNRKLNILAKKYINIFEYYIEAVKNEE
jgi:hypothetical protein